MYELDITLAKFIYKSKFREWHQHRGCWVILSHSFFFLPFYLQLMVHSYLEKSSVQGLPGHLRSSHLCPPKVGDLVSRGSNGERGALATWWWERCEAEEVEWRQWVQPGRLFCSWRDLLLSLKRNHSDWRREMKGKEAKGP